VSTTARLGLPAVSSCERQRNSEHVCRAMLGHASMDGAPVWQQTRGGSLTRPRAAERGLSGTVGVTGVGERPHVRAREQACGLKNDLTLALLGGKTPRRMAPQLAAAKRRRAQLGRGTEKRGWGFCPPRQTHAHARVHGRVDRCEGACVHMSWPRPW
jgi:hypothetical protein